MNNEIIKGKIENLDSDIINKLVLSGDCSKMTSEQKIQYMAYRCKSLDIDLAEKPFEYIKLNGKEVLYATKACTDALCRTRKIRREVSSRDKIEDIYMVVARATDDTGRYDESIGAVSISNLRGDALANAIMKAETKAKRRAVLSLCGLGMLDETELETIKDTNKDHEIRTKGFESLDPKITNYHQPSVKTPDEILHGDDLPNWTIPEASAEEQNKIKESTISWTRIELPEYLTKHSNVLSKFNGLQFYELTENDAKEVYNELLVMENKAKKQESKQFINEAKKQIRNAMDVILKINNDGDSNGTAKI